MTKGLAFWVLMIIWLVFGVCWQLGLVGTFAPIGGVVLLFILFALLGWQVFGAPIR